MAAEGEKVILVRRETNPDDLPGMIAAQGILTTRGGKTSHAAVVARGMGKTCVCGAEELDVDLPRPHSSPCDGVTVNEGDVISIDGTTGQVYLGEVPVQAVARWCSTSRARCRADADPLVAAVDRLHARTPTSVRRLGVRANADTPRGRRAGPPVRRRGHRPVPDRAHVPRRPAPAGRATDPGRAPTHERQAALDALLPLQREDFVGIFAAMDGAAGDDPADRPAAARVPARPGPSWR